MWTREAPFPLTFHILFANVPPYKPLLRTVLERILSSCFDPDLPVILQHDRIPLVDRLETIVRQD